VVEPDEHFDFVASLDEKGFIDLGSKNLQSIPADNLSDR
jgi:hypothetical protein